MQKIGFRHYENQDDGCEILYVRIGMLVEWKNPVCVSKGGDSKGMHWA